LQQPCQLPPCAAGVQPTWQAPCAKPAPVVQSPQQPGTECASTCPARPAPGTANDAPGGSGKSGAGDSDKDGEHAAPPLKPAFMKRVWRLSADADSYDGASNTLNVTVSKIHNLPKRLRSQDDDIVDQDADVIFTKKTKVYDADGKRLRTEGSYDVALDEAESVSVTGKILPQSKWNKDEDGTPVTTLRAKRVTITD
jgi:hypothetical protein